MSIPLRLQQLADEGRLAVRGMIRFDLGSGPYGFWNGNHKLAWDGLTWVPNQLWEVEEPQQAMGMEARTFTIALPLRSDFGITPDVIATIQQMDYKGRPATIYDAYFDPDTRALLHVEALTVGYMDTIEETGPADQKRMVIHCHSAALDNHRDGWRAANHEDQQLVSPGDLFFEHAGRVRSEVFDIEM